MPAPTGIRTPDCPVLKSYFSFSQTRIFLYVQNYPYISFTVWSCPRLALIFQPKSNLDKSVWCRWVPAFRKNLVYRLHLKLEALYPSETSVPCTRQHSVTSQPAKRSGAWLFALQISNLGRVEPVCLFVVMFSGNRCSSVGLVSRLRVEQPMRHVAVPGSGKRCFSCPNVCTGSGPDSVFRRVKRPGREATARSHLMPDEE